MEDINYVFTPEQPEVDYAELDFDAQLKYTQNIKGKVLHKLVNGPTGVPEDKDSVELLLKVADSMDKVTIAKRRLQVDEKQGNDAQSILNAIVQSIQLGGGKMPFLRDPNDTTELPDQAIGELKSYTDEHANGEAEIGVIIETSDHFATRMDQVSKDLLDQQAKDLGLSNDDVPNT